MPSDDIPENWRSVVDPKSGRTYWYHRITRVSTWIKPTCLENDISTPHTIKEGTIPPSSTSTSQIGVTSIIKTSRVTETLSDHMDNLITSNDMIKKSLSLNYLDKLLSNSQEIDNLLKIYPNSISIIIQFISDCKEKMNITIGYRLIWLISLSPISIDIFHSNPKLFDILTNIACSSGNIDAIYYYSVTCSLNLSSSTTNMEQLTIFVAGIPTEVCRHSLQSLYKQSIHQLIHLFDEKIMLCLSDIASKGHILPGLILLRLFSFLLESNDRLRSDRILINGGIQSIIRVASCYSTSVEIRMKSKIIMKQAMTISPYIRNKILDLFIDLSSSFDELGHPANHEDPRKTILGYSNVTTNDSTNVGDIYNFNESGELLDLPILRDVEWKSVNGNIWRLCSTVMWSRCPGLREILDGFWDSGGGGLELNIDASSETLHAVCIYIHTGNYIPPSNFLYKLEVIKVAIELIMEGLKLQAIENIEQNLTFDNVDITMEFSKALSIVELSNICQLFKSKNDNNTSIDLGINCSNSLRSHSSRSYDNGDYDNDDKLRSAAKESIDEVSKLETTNQETCFENSDEISFNSNHHQAIKSQHNHSIIQKKAKSGGIYGLILQNMENKPESISLPVETSLQHDSRTSNNYSTSEVKELKNGKNMKNGKNGKEMNIKPVDSSKYKNGKQNMLNQSTTAKNKLVQPFIIEYDPVMSLQPESVLSERDKRMNSMAKPKYIQESVSKKAEHSEFHPTSNSFGLSNTIYSSSSLSPSIEEELKVLKVEGCSDKENVRSSLQLLKLKSERKKKLTKVDNEDVLNNNNDNSSNGSDNNGNREDSKSVSIKRTESQSTVVKGTLTNTLPSNMKECPDCGRRFIESSFITHSKACAKVFLKKRRPFDSSKQRLPVEVNQQSKHQNKTDLRGMIKSPNDDSSIPKWKADSEAFRRSIKGIKSNDPNSSIHTLSQRDPNSIQCPHCSRNFNAKAAERHIPICQSIRAKPTTLKKGTNNRAQSNIRPQVI